MDADTSRLRARLDAGLEAMGIQAGEAQRRALIDYLQLLERWNRAFNLTAVRDPLEMVARHLLDSLAVAPFLHGDAILDLGTGAGLPGIPLAILEPQRRFTLLDSNGKKVRFVRQAVLALELANVTPLQARAGAYRVPQKFATMVARAVGSLAELRAVAVGLMPPPDRLLAMKGREPHEELADPALADDELIAHRLAVPFLEGDRHLIEIRFQWPR